MFKYTSMLMPRLRYSFFDYCMISQMQNIHSSGEKKYSTAVTYCVIIGRCSWLIVHNNGKQLLSLGIKRSVGLDTVLSE